MFHPALPIRLIIPALLVFGGGVATPAAKLPDSFLARHCHECHDADVAKGGLDLVNLSPDLADAAVRARWELIHDRIRDGEMPPSPHELSADERDRTLRELAASLHTADRAEVQRKGRGPLRRMTREEYEHHLRDLLALPDLDVRDKLPADRERDGYSRVSSLLDVSRVQLAGYLAAAEAALSQALASGVRPPPAKRQRMVGTDLFASLTTFGGAEAMFFARDGEWVPINGAQFKQMSPEQRRDETLELALFRSATWPYFGYPRGFKAMRDGRYRVRFSGRAVRQLRDFRIVLAGDPQPLSFRARKPSGPDVSGDVRETGGWIDLQPEPKVFETTVRLRRGETFEYSLLGLPVPFIRTDGGFFYDYPPMPPGGHRGAAFQWLEVEGPLAPESWPPESHQILFGDLPLREAPAGSEHPVEVVSTNQTADARRLLRRFARRAVGRPVPDESMRRYEALFASRLAATGSFVDAMLQACQAVLCSGRVIYLEEPRGLKASPADVARRLSHLLWSSRPDEKLGQLATSGLLGMTGNLAAEAERLIDDPRFERFVHDFADQWLDLKDVRRDQPDLRLYPEYRKDDYLVSSMERETRAFVTDLFRANRPVTELVQSRYVHVNDRLAEHYGLAALPGSRMRRVKLPAGSPYGGLLTQAAMLKHTADGTSTSPVHRGVWVARKLLGIRVPPPPKSVPAISPDVRGATTVRAQLAAHTKSKSCAACHARFDPFGFALESFDVMGAWRGRYRALEKGAKVTGVDPAGHPYTYYVSRKVDPAGRLPDGREFAGVRELKSLLAADPRALARNLLHQLTLFSTGTPVRFSDRQIVERILDRTAPAGFRARELLTGLVRSEIFLGISPR